MQLEGSEFVSKLQGKETIEPTWLSVDLCKVINMHREVEVLRLLSIVFILNRDKNWK